MDRNAIASKKEKTSQFPSISPFWSTKAVCDTNCILTDVMKKILYKKKKKISPNLGHTSYTYFSLVTSQSVKVKQRLRYAEKHIELLHFDALNWD